jgi:ABC-type bacteriocin/lantibiotic exporter with double-glycine peptidase domain
MNTRLKKHFEELQSLDAQRKGWLVLSGFVAAGVAGIIFGWNWVQQHHVVWVAVSVGLLLSVTWWYWTMRLIRQLLSNKITEAQILSELIEDIKDLKKDIRKSLDL